MAEEPRIVKTPGTCGGRARIAGHRIRVQDIALWTEHNGWSPEEIVTQFPQLRLSDVHAALAYYYDHQDEIAADRQRDYEIEAELREQQPSILEKYRKRDYGEDSILSG